MKKRFSSLTILFALGLVALVSSLVYPVMSYAAAPVAPVAAVQLTTAETQSLLLFMREEEKLAHDVYVTLYDKWGIFVFDNIANGESTHMAAIKALLDRYGLADPAAGKGVGEFTDPTLQSLYDQLVASGQVSLSGALRVGATIEEIDIRDLNATLADTTNRDVTLVYENLMKGSRNHLRAFVSTLSAQTGETYEPQYLSADEYDAIVGSGIERGPARR